ncbi:MAG: zinc ribbon domain-containing protein [Candidatus Melainabacteria bacterium]|nr:zinc ribbon domain-containing protein [Candidatus Melainabacteria bacterium]
MAGSSEITYVECPSCLRRNDQGMSFCMYCGTGLSGTGERAGTADLRSLVPCLKCGKADELSKSFCVFCGAEIYVPGSSAPDSSAFKKFSWELQRIDDIDVLRADPEQPIKKAHRQKAVNWTLLLGLLGILSGAGAAFALGGHTLQTAYLKLVLPAEGLVIYASPSATSYVLESEDKKFFLTGHSGRDGSISIKDVPPGKYTVRLSAPGHKTVRQKVPVEAKRTTLLGYPEKIVLPEKGKW